MIEITLDSVDLDELPCRSYRTAGLRDLQIADIGSSSALHHQVQLSASGRAEGAVWEQRVRSAAPTQHRSWKDPSEGREVPPTIPTSPHAPRKSHGTPAAPPTHTGCSQFPTAAAGLYITVSCRAISDNYFFFFFSQRVFFFLPFLSEHSVFSDLHLPALIICSADQFPCLEVQQHM